MAGMPGDRVFSGHWQRRGAGTGNDSDVGGLGAGTGNDSDVGGIGAGTGNDSDVGGLGAGTGNDEELALDRGY